MLMPRLIRTPDWFQSPQTKYPDLASVVRQQFTTTEEAEEYARSLGIQSVHYGQHLDIALLANEFLARLADRKRQMPVNLMVHSAYFVATYPDDFTNIPAMAENGVVLINARADLWQDVLANTRRAFAVRYWSTPAPLHAFFHEYAHLFQSETTRNRSLTPRQRTLASSVSVRACFNVEEFLCEVYAALMEGVQYDSDIMGAYHRLGGPRL
jgi:hypothetical protein